MNTLTVTLGVPEHILRGLADKSMERIGSVVRWAPGGSQGGNIVAHLPELGESLGQMTTTIIPAVALGAIQIATTVYLSRRLDRLEHAIASVSRTLLSVESDLQHVLDHQYLDVTRNVSRGMEYLVRAMQLNDGDMMRDARKTFVAAAGDIGHWLRQDAERLLEQPKPMEAMLRYDVAACAGERACISSLRLPYQHHVVALEQHANLWQQVSEGLRQVPPPKQRMPTLEMVTKHGPNLRAWRNTVLHDLEGGTATLRGHAALCKALDAAPAAIRDQLTKMLEHDTVPVIVVVGDGRA